MPAPSTKTLPLFLDRALYARLEAQARAQERSPAQEARWILKQQLGDQQRAATLRVEAVQEMAPA
jgi:hypothetical protein